jgi:glycosyltransferase involved in cell wall biosynthesis
MEIVLVDDCSSKPIPRDIGNFIRAEGVRYIRHEANCGLAVARNTAIAHARGKYFAFCDDDDEWPPRLASDLLRAVEGLPHGSGMAIAVDAAHRSACERILGGYPKLTSLIRHGITPPVSSQLYETRSLQEVNGYDPRVKSGVDHDLWISLAAVDPQVAVTWREAARVDGTLGAKKMTTEAARQDKILEALEIWKPKIVHAFGEDFYEHFCRSYCRHLDYRSFTVSLRNGKRRQALMAAVRHRHILAKVGSTVWERLTGRRRCNLFPPYSGK